MRQFNTTQAPKHGLSKQVRCSIKSSKKWQQRHNRDSFAPQFLAKLLSEYGGRYENKGTIRQRTTQKGRKTRGNMARRTYKLAQLFRSEKKPQNNGEEPQQEKKTKLIQKY